MTLSRNYLFAGASSAMALETARLLKAQGHHLSGLSRQSTVEEVYDRWVQVNDYSQASLPRWDEPLHGLVYFPGSIQLKPFHRLTEEEFLEDYRINSLGAVSFLQNYWSLLKGSQAPSVVLISSVAASSGMPFHASVAMAKGAVEALVRALAAEWAPGIRVNAVAPSLTETPLASKFINTQDKVEAAQKRNPLKQVGKARDIASSVAFLLGEESRWITGQVWAVDGGMGRLKLL